MTLLDYPFDVSPDGRTIVYGHRDAPGQPGGVYLLDIGSGAPPRFLMPMDFGLPDPRDFRFSPDGQKVAFVRGVWDSTGVYVRDIVGGAEYRVTPPGIVSQSPDWDPTGRYLVYGRPWLPYGEPDSIAGIHIVDTQTLEDRSLRHGELPTFGGGPRWSPDGAWVCFWYGTRLGPGERPSMALHVYRVRVDGTAYEDLTPDSHVTDNDEPNWVAGGQQILFEMRYQKVATRRATLAMQADGTALQLWPIDVLYGFTALSRDGSTVVFPAADPTGRYGVLYIQGSRDTTGRSRVQLTAVPSP